MSKWKFFFIAVLFFCDAHARQPYHATVTVAADSTTVSAPNLVDLKRDLKTTALQQLLPVYTPTSPASLNFNIRGIIALAAFPANSTTLIVSIPQAGVTQTFTGATRDDSLTIFKDFIRDAGTNHQLLKAYARFSPIDPIAGNPNSLMAQMPQADYLLGHLSPLSGCDCCWSAQPIVRQVQIGTYVARAFSKGFDTTVVTLPLRYSFSPDLRWAFILDALVTYLRNGGASSVVSSLGVGLRVPIGENWSLTPVVRGGFGGTLDLCTSGTFVSTGATSVFNYKIFDCVFSLTNYAGFINSTNFWMTGVNFNYNLHSWVLKNGFSITSCDAFTLCQRPINFSVSFIDSYFTKNHLFIRHYDEVGVSLIANCLIPHLEYDCLTCGFAYQFGEKEYKAYQFNFVYQF